MKQIAIALIAVLLTLSNTSAQDLEKYILKVNNFRTLEVVEGINVDYKHHPDSAGLAVFTSPREKASYLMFTPKKDKLQIRLSNDASKVSGLPTVTVYSDTLEKVENSGDSLVRVYNPVQAQKLQVKVVGNGRLSIHDIDVPEISAKIMTGKGQIVLEGTCSSASYSVVGKGTIQADRMKADNVSTKIVGTGNIGCYCSGRLTVHGMGSGKVYYTGNPQEVSSGSLGISATPIE